MQKLLLVEDDLNVLEHLKTFLKDEWIVITANNGQEGLERFVEHSDIIGILTDLKMPVMDGVEMLQQIRAQPNGQNPLMLVFSGYFSDESIEELNELGKVIKLVKPVSGERLKQVLKAAILFEELNDRGKSAVYEGKKNILVVDDSQGIRQAFKEYFTGSTEYRIYLASDAKQGEEQFVSGTHIDFIFTDIEMGEVNGLQFISRIRSLPKGDMVPVVIMSTYVNQELKKEGESLGVIAYLNKPFNLDSVAKVMKIWIAKSAKLEHSKGSFADVFQKLLSSSTLPEETKSAFRHHIQKYFSDMNLRKDGLLNEIIEREKIENLMIRNNIAMQELSDQKAKIVRMLCHDLSNSITIIKASAMREKKYAEPNANLKNIERILRAVSNVEDMVSQVKTLEAVSTGKESLKLEPVNLLKVLDEVEFTFEEKLNEKKLKLELVKDGNQEYFVEADRISLTNQVLNNLISNAIKFSLEDGVIRILAAKIGKNRIRVSVQDFGIGMPNSLLNDIFSFNEKTSRPGTKNELGTGFGMPLVKSFMDSYGGDIEIESTEKSSATVVHGTTVHLFFKIPVSKW